MAWDYETDVAAAIEDIRDVGRPITIEKKTDDTGSLADPISGDPDTFDTDVEGNALYGAFFSYRESQIDGTTVIQGDQIVLVPAFGAVPEAGDIVIDGSDRYTIANPGNLNPGSTMVMHVMQIRESAAG